MAVSNLKRYFCSLLKRHIKANNVRQLDIAELLGISGSAVSQMLSGMITPKLQQLDLIMEYLKLDRNTAAELRDCLARIRSGDQELRSPLNDFIKSSRIRCGLTLEKLSQMSGIPEENLQMLENKVNVQPTPHEAVRLAAIFNCNVSELWQVVPELPAKTPAAPTLSTPGGPVLRDKGAPFQRCGTVTIKLPIIKLEDMLNFNPLCDHLIDFAWRHMIGVENGEKVGLVIVTAPGTEFGWSELYDVRIEIAEVKQWLPGMTVLCNINNELFLARALNEPWQVMIQGLDESCECNMCWMVNSLDFVSELFSVTAPARVEQKLPITVFGKKSTVAGNNSEE